MSNPALVLATTIASQSVRNGDATEVLADALLQSDKDCRAAHDRYAALYRENGRLVHEIERLREGRGAVAQETRLEPGYARYCLNTDCTASIVRNAAPPDWAIPAWLVGLGWSTEGYCPECKERL